MRTTSGSCGPCFRSRRKWRKWWRQNAEPGPFGGVFESAIAWIAVKPIQEARLAIYRSSSHRRPSLRRRAMVAVNIDSASSVEHGAPVVDTQEQLTLVGFDCAKS